METAQERRQEPRTSEDDVIAFSNGLPVSPLTLAFSEVHGDPVIAARFLVNQIAKGVAWLPPNQRARAIGVKLEEAESGLGLLKQGSKDPFNDASLKQLQDVLGADVMRDELDDDEDDDDATPDEVQAKQDQKTSLKLQKQTEFADELDDAMSPVGLIAPLGEVIAEIAVAGFKVARAAKDNS